MLGLPWISAPPATYKVNTGNELRSMGKSKLNKSFNHINECFSVPIIIHQALIHFNSNYLKEKACDHPHLAIPNRWDVELDDAMTVTMLQRTVVLRQGRDHHVFESGS
jgi:hypothetical protein